MSFLIYDLTFLVLFSLFVVIFLWKRKKNLKREGIMYLYRTKVGVKLIDYIGTKYKKTLRAMSVLAVISGYALMASMVYFLYRLIYIYFFVPEIVQAIKIPPLMPLIPYLPSLFKIDFLPPFYFTYWIIAIACIAIFHEFAHGIIAKRYGVNIKTTGFGFLGPFLAAFVEPDEKQMEKKTKFQQISVLSAGTFVNLILAIFFFLLLAGFFFLAYVPSGAMFNSYATGVVTIGGVSMLDGININNPSAQGLLDIIEENEITDNLVLGSNGNQINLTKMIVNGDTYYITIENLKEQLGNQEEFIVLFEDMPAINMGLRGVIIQIESKEIKTTEDVSNVLENFHPNENITIMTKDGEELLTYEIQLGEHPEEEGKAMVGIGYQGSQRGSLLGRVYEFFNFFKKPATFYEPRFNVDLIIFIYNLIWWLALINLSVALINMWPVAIFDGGRMFMLTIWAITGSEKIGKIVFKILTYLILGALAALMFGWFNAMFG
jgi:membrane-associated protease RseP (regulator of RpoE activity)